MKIEMRMKGDLVGAGQSLDQIPVGSDTCMRPDSPPPPSAQ
jgi:hypothetical protein